MFILENLRDETFLENEEIRVFSAAKNIDLYLSCFNLSLHEKLQFCREMELAFEKEFNSELKKQIYSKYREQSNSIFYFMKKEVDSKSFNNMQNSLKTLPLAVENLPSYIHMSINRWFTSQQRVYEYMCYTFLVKYYDRILNTTT